jgi:hypothetical protein
MKKKPVFLLVFVNFLRLFFNSVKFALKWRNLLFLKDKCFVKGTVSPV